MSIRYIIKSNKSTTPEKQLLVNQNNNLEPLLHIACPNCGHFSCVAQGYPRDCKPYHNPGRNMGEHQARREHF